MVMGRRGNETRTGRRGKPNEVNMSSLRLTTSRKMEMRSAIGAFEKNRTELLQGEQNRVFLQLR